MQILMRLVSFKRPISQAQKRIFLPYGDHKTSNDIGGKEAARLQHHKVQYRKKFFNRVVFISVPVLQIQHKCSS
jgi:hypothetical protein